MVNQLEDNVINDPEVRIVKALLLLSSPLSSNQLIRKLPTSSNFFISTIINITRILESESNPNPVLVLAILCLLLQSCPGQIAVNPLRPHLWYWKYYLSNQL